MTGLKDLVPYTCKLSLLYIDRDLELLNSITTILKKVFLWVDDANSSSIGSSCLKANNYDLVIIDLSSDMAVAQELISEIKSISKYQHILVTTKGTTPQDDLKIYSMGVDYVLKKPFTASSMLDQILYITSKLANDRSYLKEDIEKLNNDLLYERKRIGRFMINEKKLKDKIQLYEGRL